MLSSVILKAGETAAPSAASPAKQDPAGGRSLADPRRKSTDDVPEKDRLDYWQYVVSELIGTVELKDYDREDFNSGFGLSTVGDLKIGHFTGVSQTLERKSGMIKSSDPDDYIVLLESNKTFNLEQAGRQHSGSGGMVLIDIAQPYFSNHPEGIDVIDVFIPRQVMERAMGSARHAAGLSIDASQPIFPVIVAFLRSLSQHGAKLDPANAARMSAIAVDLIASGLTEKLGEATPRHASGAAILARAQAYIAENLGVTGLGMLEVAATLNLSIRRLHQIAADEGISLVDWMWERRLLRARKLLADPAHQMQSVGTIAYQCGFVDQAHFSRRFKLRFGQAPSELRTSSQTDRALPTA